MVWDKMQRSWSEALFTNKVLAFANLLLIVAVILLTMEISKKDTRTHLVLPEMSSESWVSLNSASANYLQSIGMFIANLSGNVTPSNIDFTIESLSNMVDSDIYNDFRSTLYMEADRIKQYKASHTFEANEANYDPQTGKVYITGVKTIKAPATDDKKFIQTFELDIKIRNGMPIMTEYSVYDGKAQRTELNKEKKG